MINKPHFRILVFALPMLLAACSADNETPDPWVAIRAKFANTIDPDNLDNYANQSRPA